MNLVLLLVLLLVVLALVALVILKKRGRLGGVDGPWPFYAKRPLSSPEQVLYHGLVRVLPEHIVLAQVQVSRILGVKKGFNFHEWNNRINRLSYDFGSCVQRTQACWPPSSWTTTRTKQHHAETDKKKVRATSAAGIRLIRWHVKSLPDQIAIQAAFSEKQSNASIGGTEAGKPAVAPDKH